MNFSFSVLMSVYYKDNPIFFDRALKSIIDDQILKPNEIVLVKDGPLTDELEKVIKKWKDKTNNLFKIIAFEKNKGLGEALRIGIQECKYELIARMDSDDISKSERFFKEIEIFKSNSEIDMVGSWINEFWEIDNKIILKKMRQVPENDEEIKRKLKILSAFNHPTVMYKKSKVIESGNYNEKYHYMEDYYLWVRMALNNCKFYNIQESLLLFRTTPDTYKRRGGLKFVKADFKFQKELFSLGFINRIEYIKNLNVRFIYRMIPSNIRSFLLNKIFRR